MGYLYKEYIKTARNSGFWEKLLSEDDFEAILAIFCCSDHSTNASEAGKKITTDQKSLLKMHFVC